jgi:hypothetical protein
MSDSAHIQGDLFLQLGPIPRVRDIQSLSLIIIDSSPEPGVDG